MGEKEKTTKIRTNDRKKQVKNAELCGKMQKTSKFHKDFPQKRAQLTNDKNT